VQYRGVRGAIAATRGDSVQALEDASWLEHLERPYLNGDHLLN